MREFRGQPSRPPEYRMLANRVYVMLSENNFTGYSMDNRSFNFTIDNHELVEPVIRKTVWDAELTAERALTNDERNEAHRTACNFLIELGIAEWRPIGPEDAELFLTDRARDYFFPQLTALKRDWTTWTVEETPE